METQIPFLKKPDFSQYVADEIQKLRKYDDFRIELTGNQYTDTAIFIVSALHQLHFKSDFHPSNLKLKHVLDVFSYGEKSMENGRELAWINYKAKSTYMLFPNNPIIQSAYTKKKEKKDLERMPQNGHGPSILAEHVYIYYLLEFLKGIPDEKEVFQCTYCGLHSSFNFNKIEANIQKQLFKKTSKFTTGLTKSWYPLFGTISEAQAYHGYSQQPYICPKCLFLVHYLPQGTRLFKGKLLFFQTNDINISFQFAKINLEEFLGKYSADPENSIISPGKGEKKQVMYLKLLEVLKDISALKGEDFFSNQSDLTLWMVTNSNQGAQADIEQIPSIILQNLALINSRWSSSLKNFLISDEKSGYISFIDSMKKEEEYLGFYRETSKNHVPLEFYEFYQTGVIERPKEMLEFYKKICIQIKEKYSVEDIIASLKLVSKERLHQIINKEVINLIVENEIDVSLALTWIIIELKRNGYKPFEYYLHPKVQPNSNPTFVEIPKSKLVDIIKIASISYIRREKSKGGFAFNKFKNNLLKEKKGTIIYEIRKIGREVLGFGWKKYLEAFKILNSRNSNQILLLFKIIAFSEVNKEENEQIKLDEVLDFSLYEKLDKCEAESLLSNNLIQFIYSYLKQRHLDEEFTLSRAILDFKNIVENSNRSLNSFIHYFRKRTLSIDENEFYASQKNSELFINDYHPHFSWYKMKNQILNFLDQLSICNTLHQEVLERIGEI